MAVYFLELKPLAAARAHAAAAYRARETLRDSDGSTWPPKHDPRDLRAKGIALPDGAPSWASNRAALWNAATDAERVRKRGHRCGEYRKRARAGRTMILALPCELTDAQRSGLAAAFAQRLADRYDVAADWAIHAPDAAGDQRNHHLHLAITDRRLGAGGFGSKVRELTDRKKGPQEVSAVRAMWEETANRHLARAGRAEQIDARTLAAQGIRRPPTKKRGAAGALARRKPAASHAAPYIAAEVVEIREARRAALLTLARQVRQAFAANLPEQARALWRHLLANARDALRDPNVSARGLDALALAKWAQRTEEALEAPPKPVEAPKPPEGSISLAEHLQDLPKAPGRRAEDPEEHRRTLLARVTAGQRADGKGARPCPRNTLPSVPSPVSVVAHLAKVSARSPRQREDDRER